MSKQKHLRKRCLVDTTVQGAVVKESLWYWIWGTTTFAFVIVIYRVVPATFAGQNDVASELWYHLGPLLFASLALFPLVVYRSIRFTHRFVGPMVRFRNTLRKLAAGHQVQEIQLRDGDFWTEYATDIDRVARRLNDAETRPSFELAPSPDVVESNEPKRCEVNASA